MRQEFSGRVFPALSVAMVADDKMADVAGKMGNQKKALKLIIVPAAEIFFQPEVENNKEVAASHLPYLQFCDSVATIAPSDGNDRKGVAANDSFEWQLNREVKVGREKRAETIQASFAVSLKGVSCVVQAVAKEHADVKVC